MAKNWSRSAWDDLILSGGVYPRPTFQPRAPRKRNFGLPALSLLVGVIVALLYVWPVLMMTLIIAGGIRPAIFWSVLVGSAAVVGLVTWAITTFERRYWGRNWQKVGDWADPPYWR